MRGVRRYVGAYPHPRRPCSHTTESGSHGTSNRANYFAFSAKSLAEKVGTMKFAMNVTTALPIFSLIELPRS